jgi:predicted transglutaminase-like cysteine proteinase
MNRWIKLALAGGCAVLTLAGPEAREGRPPLDAVLESGKVTQPPMGYVQFCRDFPEDCRTGPRAARVITLTKPRWQELDRINRAVNRAVVPATDQELYHVPERWSYPVAKGDCEDYVILKRKMLMRHGWPEEALLITVVRDRRGEGHAVLTVRTNRGDFILDNQAEDIRTWRDTGYKFVKRQAEWDPTVWVSLTPPSS